MGGSCASICRMRSPVLRWRFSRGITRWCQLSLLPHGGHPIRIARLSYGLEPDLLFLSHIVEHGFHDRVDCSNSLFMIPTSRFSQQARKAVLFCHRSASPLHCGWANDTEGKQELQRPRASASGESE